MKRKVIGYDKTLEYLKKGYELYSYPMTANDYFHITDENGVMETITVRSDVFGKLLKNGYRFDRKIQHYTNVYTLKEKL